MSSLRILRRHSILHCLRNHRHLRRTHHSRPLPFPHTLQGLAFPIDEPLYVRAQPDPHVQDVGPRNSLVEDADKPAAVRQILSVEHSAKDHGIPAPDFEVGR